MYKPPDYVFMKTIIADDNEQGVNFVTAGMVYCLHQLYLQ